MGIKLLSLIALVFGTVLYKAPQQDVLDDVIITNENASDASSSNGDAGNSYGNNAFEDDRTVSESSEASRNFEANIEEPPSYQFVGLNHSGVELLQATKF